MIRFLSAATMLLALTVTMAAPAGTAGEGQAITQGVTITLPDGSSPTAFLDGNRSTFQQLPAGTHITVESETPFAHITLIWDAPPQPWQLDVNGTRLAAGQHAFLHETISLNTPAAAATLFLGDAAYTLCDIVLHSEGALPAGVQQWQPSLIKADLLVLPTHADDEYIFFGGILPAYAGEKGVAVQVAYLTNHLETERYRPHELLDGLWEAGVTAYPVMGPFPDVYASKESLAAAENVFGRENVLAFQVELLRRFKPSVVIGHDLNGEYGHGAHMLNAVTLLEAVPLAADAAAFPDSAAHYDVWNVPKVYLHLYAENQLVMDWDAPLPAFGGKTAHEMAVAGFAKHVSQSTYYSVNAAAFAESGSVYENRTFGLAHTTVGTDEAKNDFFEHIDLTPEPPPEPGPASEPASEVSSPPSQSAVSTPPTSTPPGPNDAESAPGWLLPVLLGGAGLLSAMITAGVVLALRAQKRKRRRARHHWQPKR